MRNKGKLLCGFLMASGLLASCGMEEGVKEMGPDLAGTSWKSECSAEGDSGSIMEMTFTATEYTMTMNHFNERTDCSGTAQWKLAFMGTYVRKDTKEGGEDGFYLMDMTQSSVTLAPVGSTNAAAFNSMKYCSKSDWAADTAVDLSTITCASFSGMTDNNGQVQSSRYMVDSDNFYLSDKTLKYTKQ